jgi:hypothetical protein
VVPGLRLVYQVLNELKISDLSKNIRTLYGLRFFDSFSELPAAWNLVVISWNKAISEIEQRNFFSITNKVKFGVNFFMYILKIPVDSSR